MARVSKNEFNRLAQIARGKVQVALKAGRLVHPSKLECSDCGGKATMYDHRNYYKPLEVSPVCRSCNSKRGAAYPEPEERYKNNGIRHSNLNDGDGENALFWFSGHALVEPDESFFCQHEEYLKLYPGIDPDLFVAIKELWSMPKRITEEAEAA